MRSKSRACAEPGLETPQLKLSKLIIQTRKNLQVSLVDAEKRARELAFQVKMLAEVGGSPGAVCAVGAVCAAVAEQRRGGLVHLVAFQRWFGGGAGGAGGS